MNDCSQEQIAEAIEEFVKNEMATSYCYQDNNRHIEEFWKSWSLNF